MAFIFDFDNSISTFNFKNTLTYDKANIFLKQSSLVSYSLVDVLKNYYNIFEINKNLSEINIETPDEDIQIFLKNSLSNMMYDKLFGNNINNKIVNLLSLNKESNDGIEFILKNPSFEGEKTNSIKIPITNDLYTSYDNEKGIDIEHKTYINSSGGLSSNIEGWNQTIKIPYLKTTPFGHIINSKNLMFKIPNPIEKINIGVIDNNNYINFISNNVLDSNYDKYHNVNFNNIDFNGNTQFIFQLQIDYGSGMKYDYEKYMLFYDMREIGYSLEKDLYFNIGYVKKISDYDNVHIHFKIIYYISNKIISIKMNTTDNNRKSFLINNIKEMNLKIYVIK